METIATDGWQEMMLRHLIELYVCCKCLYTVITYLGNKLGIAPEELEKIMVDDVKVTLEQMKKNTETLLKEGGSL